MAAITIDSTVIFEKNYTALDDPSIRFIINEGGSRSSKTYSLCQMIIVYCIQHPNKVVSVVRKTFPALRATVMRDFFEIMKSMEIYDVQSHNKSEHIYTFPNGSIVEFLAWMMSRRFVVARGTSVGVMKPMSYGLKISNS